LIPLPNSAGLLTLQLSLGLGLIRAQKGLQVPVKAQARSGHGLWVNWPSRECNRRTGPLGELVIR